MEKRNGLINYEALEQHILQIENILQPLTPPEKELLLKQVGERLHKQMSQQRSQDIINNMSMGSLMKKAMGSIKNEPVE